MSGRAADIAELKALVARLRREYSDDPNIRSIGWGLTRRRGALQDELGVIFLVRAKIASPRAIEAAGSRPIPAEIDGVPTDVEESNPGIVSAGHRDEEKFDALIGGVASSNAEGHTYWFNSNGTLGLLVRDAGDGAPMALSNWHVWADGGEAGDAVIQPGHPTGGDHVEGVVKVAACGPLLTAAIEWEAPTPLAAGLYGAAAAAALAAAASDLRDPIRRGQDATPVEAGELTIRETVEMAIEYPQLPLPGRPFGTKVAWQYARETGTRVLGHVVEEHRVNAQFLLGKMVVTDRAAYRPGERVRLDAAIWDYQPRPCDAYHVVAHMIPHASPDKALRVVLHPAACPRTMPPFPPEDDDAQETCVTFEQHAPGSYPSTGVFGWLSYAHPAGEPVRIVEWLEGMRALAIPRRGLRLSHAPAGRIVARVAQFAGPPVSVVALDAAGQEVGQATAPDAQGVVHELEIRGDGIAGARLRGGSGEGLLVAYCVDRAAAPSFTPAVAAAIEAGIARELPELAMSGRLRAHRCCFSGSIALPPIEKPGRWDVHLVVQTVNDVPDGTPPEKAAATIGGHVVSSHAAPDVLGCAVVMLLDHAFDVI